MTAERVLVFPREAVLTLGPFTPWVSAGLLLDGVGSGLRWVRDTRLRIRQVLFSQYSVHLLVTGGNGTCCCVVAQMDVRTCVDVCHWLSGATSTMRKDHRGSFC